MSDLLNLTYDHAIKQLTVDYLDSLDKDNLPKPTTISCTLIEKTNVLIRTHNKNCLKDEKWPKLFGLKTYQLAEILIKLHGAIRINTGDNNASSPYDLIGIYNKTGPNAGIYTTDDSSIRSIIRDYAPNLSSIQFKETMLVLDDFAPRKAPSRHPDLIAVNNGIYDYRLKMLMDFDPEIVFLSKSHVNFVENAPNPKIYNPDDGTYWDVISWFKELSDDPEVVTLLWEICGAVIRPNVPWNKSAWLYSEQGNNGKGTLCTLMRNLCGSGSAVSIPLKDFSKDFALEPLIAASAIIVDENPVGTYIDQADNLKSVITNDMISINRKYKPIITYRFHGFMVQCLNEFPKAKDKSDSFYRRQLYVPMTKSFKGVERKYIKSDYLYRQEVLEHVLYKLLAETDYYELSNPKACQLTLDLYKEINDPIRQFFADVENETVWTVLPYTFLYDFYLAWMAKNLPGGKPIGRNNFLTEIKKLVTESDIFDLTDSSQKLPSKGTMDYPEPLIWEYKLTDWMSSSKSSDINRRCIPDLQRTYRGITRK